MAAPISPGDWVEYVGSDDPNAISMNLLVRGSVYQVARLVQARGLDGGLHPALILRGVSRGAWTIKAFRPIYRPKQELIEQLKAPPKQEPVREKEVSLSQDSLIRMGVGGE